MSNRPVITKPLRRTLPRRASTPVDLAPSGNDLPKTANRSRGKLVDPPVQADDGPLQLIDVPKFVDSPTRPSAPTKAPALMSWLEQLGRIQQRVVNCRFFSWSVAAYAQLLLLVVLGALAFTPAKKQEPMQITVSFSSDRAQQEAEVVIPPVEEPPEEEPEAEVVEPEQPEPEEVVEVTEPEELLPTVFEPSEVAPVASAKETDKKEMPVSEAKTEPSPQKPEPPKPEPPTVRLPPASAQIVGAFSAWTEPENPAPGQPYVIVIQVTLPERIKRYASSDLSGVIIGADGYQKFIRGSKTQLPIIDHTARIRIPVIGAERSRKDSIVIQSRILRQRQLIELNYSESWAARMP